MMRMLKNWLPSWFSPNKEQEDNLQPLRVRSQDLYRNDAIYKALNDRIVDWVIGSGTRLHCRIDRKTLGLTDDEAEEWEDNTENLWALYAESTEADSARKMTFGQIERLACLSWSRDGEVLALLPDIQRKGSAFSLRVQLVEAEYLQQPMNEHRSAAPLGIETGEGGAPEFYHFAKLNETGFAESWSRVQAFGESGRQNVVHLLQEDRPQQMRGVPIGATVIPKAKNRDRYDEAEQVASLVSTYFTAWVKSNDPDAAESPLGDDNDDDSASGDGQDYEMGPGAVQYLAPDEDVVFSNPTRPNSNYQAWVDAQLREIAMSVGIPPEILIQKFDSSYTAARGAMITFYKKRVLPLRAHFTQRFNQPIYNEWLTDEILRGSIKAPGYFSDPLRRLAWQRALFIGPAMGAMDELKEAQAAEKRLQVGLTTLAEETLSATGGDWKTNTKKRKHEEAQGATITSGTQSNPSPAEQAAS